MSLTVLKELTLAVPPADTIKKFNHNVSSYLKLIMENRLEIATLTQLRDTLLPKLISGEVRVKDAEQTVANAL